MPEITINPDNNGISIQRTRNGWLVHTWGPWGMHRDATTALAVAETADALCRIVREWAEAIESQAKQS